MTENKAIQIVRTLAQRERNSLREFIASPYFNQSEKLETLCNLIIDLVENHEDITLNEKLLCRFNDIQDKDIDLKHFNVLLNHLNRKIEWFLITEKMKRDEITSDIYLLKQLQERNLNKTFESRYKKVIARLNKTKLEADLYYNLFTLKGLYWTFRNKNSSEPVKRVQIKGDEFDYLNLYHYVLDLKQTARAVGEEREYRDLQVNNDKVMDFVQDYKDKTYEDNPLISLYLLCLMMFYDVKTPQYFYQYKSAVLKNAALFSRRELNELLQLALGYCYYMNISGKDKQFNNEAMELNKYILDNNVLDFQPYMDDLTFKNMVLSFCNANEYGYAKKFVREYAAKLNPNDREALVNFNLGVIHYRQQQFDKALRCFDKLEGRMPVFYEITFRLAKTSIYYQQNEWVLLGAHLKSLQNFIYRNQHISDEYKEYYLNFVKYTKKLIKASTPKKLLELKQQLEGNENVNNRGWVLHLVEQKLNDLKVR